MAVAALTLRRMSGCPAVSLAMLCLLFLSLAPLWTAAAPANEKPVSGTAVTPNSLLPGLGGYPGYPVRSGGYPRGIGVYPPVVSPYDPMKPYPQPNAPMYGSAPGNACMICSWRTMNMQWYLQNYGVYEQMGYDPCLICSYGM